MGRRQGIALGRDVYFYSSLRLFGQRYMQKKRMDNFYYHRFNPALNIILYKNFQYRNERSAVYNHSAEFDSIYSYMRYIIYSVDDERMRYDASERRFEYFYERYIHNLLYNRSCKRFGPVCH